MTHGADVAAGARVARSPAPHSMTGFGRAQSGAAAGTGDGAPAVSVEVRSVNNRYLTVKTRLPQRLLRLESQLEEDVRARVSRGSVEVSVRFAAGARTAKPVVDERLAAAWLEALERVRSATQVAGKPDLPLLLQMPGVVALEEPEAEGDAEALAVRGALGAALDALVMMRAAEGARLALELEHGANRVEAIARDLEERARTLPDEYRQRVGKRLEALLANVAAPLDPGVLEREVALLADRSDVREELARLHSHVAAFRHTLAKGGPVGRALDFVVQELGREANTIGSKSQDAGVTQRVIELKTEIERLREQVQNLE